MHRPRRLPALWMFTLAERLRTRRSSRQLGGMPRLGAGSRLATQREQVVRSSSRTRNATWIESRIEALPLTQEVAGA